MTEVNIIGGGLAGSEAALTLADGGVPVRLYEMRPHHPTGAHHTAKFAEIVCSNSLGSKLPNKANGLLLAELKLLGCNLLAYIDKYSVNAGGAMAVDRDGFSLGVTEAIEAHPLIEIFREEVTTIPDSPTLIASGPLTSEKLAQALQDYFGVASLSFFDALSPIVLAESINLEIAFRASRYDEGINPEGDYLNCPLDKNQYEKFVGELVRAEKIALKSFEEAIRSGVKAGMHHFFEGCLPVEIIAERGVESLAFGPMKPVGLKDPSTGRRPHAVCQLRQDNLAGSLYNLVGFQTNLKFSEQERVFRLIPGLEKAEFVRHGQMHRNTFLASPQILTPALHTKKRADLFLAGQITGIEGYLGNIASGHLAAQNLLRFLRDVPPLVLPRETMLGALCHYITHCELKNFQPMKANFGILPPIPEGLKIGKRERGEFYAKRSLEALQNLNQAHRFGKFVD